MLSNLCVHPTGSSDVIVIECTVRCSYWCELRARESDTTTNHRHHEQRPCSSSSEASFEATAAVASNTTIPIGEVPRHFDWLLPPLLPRKRRRILPFNKERIDPSVWYKTRRGRCNPFGFAFVTTTTTIRALIYPCIDRFNPYCNLVWYRTFISWNPSQRPNAATTTTTTTIIVIRFFVRTIGVSSTNHLVFPKWPWDRSRGSTWVMSPYFIIMRIQRPIATRTTTTTIIIIIIRYATNGMITFISWSIRPFNPQSWRTLSNSCPNNNHYHRH